MVRKLKKILCLSRKKCSNELKDAAGKSTKLYHVSLKEKTISKQHLAAYVAGSKKFCFLERKSVGL